MHIHCVSGRENHLRVLMSINHLTADVIRCHPGATNMAQLPTGRALGQGGCGPWAMMFSHSSHEGTYISGHFTESVSTRPDYAACAEGGFLKPLPGQGQLSDVQGEEPSVEPPWLKHIVGAAW